VRPLAARANSIVSDVENVLIPRITFTHELPSVHTLIRRQFPLAPAYATTFNSCQGLTLDCITIDLTRPVFSHRQLYTALTRIRTRRNGLVRLSAEELNYFCKVHVTCSSTSSCITLLPPIAGAKLGIMSCLTYSCWIPTYLERFANDVFPDGLLRVEKKWTTL